MGTDDDEAGFGDEDIIVDAVEEVAEGGGCDAGGPDSVGNDIGCKCMGMIVFGERGPKPCIIPSSDPSVLFDLPPLFLGRLVPGGASRLTVQYDPNPGSDGGRGCRSNSRLRDRW